MPRKSSGSATRPGTPSAARQARAFEGSRRRRAETDGPKGARLAPDDGRQSQLVPRDEQYLAVRRALEEAVDRYQDVFDSAPVGLMSLSHRAIVLEANTYICALLGRDRHVLVGNPFLTRVFQDDRRTFLEYLHRCQSEGLAVREDLRLVRFDGNVAPVQLLLQRSRLDGQVVFRAVFVDLSERYQHEQERLAAELHRERLERDEELARRASQAKDRFLAVLSHELRTPLTPVMFALARLASLPDLPQQALPLIRVIMRNLDLERQLIDDLLDMNRIANGKLVVRREALDVHDIVRDAIGVLEREIQDHHLRVRTTLQASDSIVTGDANRLRQVFWNLLSNAVKFTEAGGEVRVSSFNPASGRIILVVTDTGVGIEAGRISVLFEPFEQVNRGDAAIGGLGLGLSICRGVIEAHDGAIRASSRGPGEGSTFEVELPVAPVPIPA